MQTREGDKIAGNIAKLSDDAMRKANRLKYIVSASEKEALVAAFSAFAEAAAQLAKAAAIADSEVASLRVKLGIAAAKIDKAVMAEARGERPMPHVYSAETAVSNANEIAGDLAESAETVLSGAVDLRDAANKVK